MKFSDFNEVTNVSRYNRKKLLTSRSMTVVMVEAQKGTSDEVKRFGQQMADDHGKASEELKTLAQNKHIPLPTDLAPKDKALRDRLSKMSGPAFDRAYMQAMVTDHVKDVSAFSRTSRTAKDEDVKSFAAKTLPTVQEHLRMARDGNRAVGTSGKK